MKICDLHSLPLDLVLSILKEPCAEIVRFAKADMSDRFAEERASGEDGFCCPVISALHKVSEKNADTLAGFTLDSVSTL